ncbi:hypothetical protein AMELA_G00233730 [Ameiurus melas]|uniref:tRNA pseudouridine(55) synthase n=1 Tax=Ameiurus melas TaxID=219545 RepID=A0A7J5ZZK6_AMEME|nr:hypothetical protein AMELA_G00233730 [Ameiurus melas]
MDADSLRFCVCEITTEPSREPPAATDCFGLFVNTSRTEHILSEDIPFTMLPLKDKDHPVIRKLLAAGCCGRCVLRFCCVGKYSSYQQSCEDIEKALLAFLGKDDGDQSHDASEEAETGDPPCKKMKLESPGENASADGASEPKVQSGVCVACVGVLQHFCDQSYAKQVSDVVRKGEYRFDSLMLAVSLPAQLSVREHSLWLHIKKEVREKSMCLDKEDVVQVKDAFKWAVQGLVGKELGASVLANSAFEVSVGFAHPETDGDCHFLATECPDCFKPTKNKASVFTRMAVVKALEKISDTKFLKHYPCPPVSPSSQCTPLDTTCLHAPVFIAGRPFAIELLNPHRAKFNRAEMRQLQETINTSSDKIRVRDLQIVTREATSRMKEGEEEKTKSYSALIWTQKPITPADLDFFETIKELKIDQKTPLRVLHRRPLAVRQRHIHSMSASYLDTHHFTLQLRTQAGTYIKEFVHGDFGRTKPNLGALMETEVDILELDVEVCFIEPQRF